MSADRILFLPAWGGELGTGHLRRARDAVLALGKRAVLLHDTGRTERMLFPIDMEGVPLLDPADLEPLFPTAADGGESFPVPHPSVNLAGTIVVFDRRSSEADDLRTWVLAGAVPVLIDDDGPARSVAPYLIDIIPGPRRTGANLVMPSLMQLPPRRREPDAGGSVLVSFGGSDPGNLAPAVARCLVERCGIPADRVSVTRPPVQDGQVRDDALPSGVRVLDLPFGLKNHLAGYGLVICRYGLTVWEALAAGCAVLTIDPTRYHRRLSTRAGLGGFLLPAGGRVSSVHQLPARAGRRLRRLLSHPTGIEESSRRASGLLTARDAGGSLPGLLAVLEAPPACCTACGSLLPRVCQRFPGRTYYRCGDCGMTGLYRFEHRDDEYGPAYFEREYRNQYGRTYLEDWNHIRKMADARIAIIREGRPSGERLLDIGCAYGPFLDAAAGAGFDPFGIDVSAEATAYVRNVLGIPAAQGAFPDFDPAAAFGVDGFDVVTLWYVIEHFPDLKKVLKSLNGVLHDGGILALSTPNGSGISGIRSQRRFLEHSPRDHYTVWSPRVARRLLAAWGFRVYRIRITGHHPERIVPGVRDGSALHRFIMLVSRIFGLGDTFEIYAGKESSCG